MNEKTENLIKDHHTQKQSYKRYNQVEYFVYKKIIMHSKFSPFSYSRANKKNTEFGV